MEAQMPLNYIPTSEEILVVVGDSETDEHGVFKDQEVMATIEVTASAIYSKDDVFQMSLNVKNLTGLMTTEKKVVRVDDVVGQLYEVTMYLQNEQPIANMKFILTSPLDDIQIGIMYRSLDDEEQKEPDNGIWQ